LDRVIANLFKQAIVARKKVPSLLIRAYDDVQAGSQKPPISVLVDMFITYAKEGPASIVIFDALDECTQRGDILSRLILPLYKSGIRIIITYRPHVLQDPKMYFESFTMKEVRACEEDVTIYVSDRLEVEEKCKRLPEVFKNRIKKEIVERSKGM
jgi:hypothetical protein